MQQNPGRPTERSHVRRDGSAPYDIVCLSHLRWDFVYQRPQHLLSRFGRERRVLFFEEPLWHDGAPCLDLYARGEGVTVAVPQLPHGMEPAAAEAAQRTLLDELLAAHGVRDFVLWYYTPLALGFSRHLEPLATVYDVMDELSLFRFAPPELLTREQELFRRADIVFTGGRSLYEAKRDRHAHVHCLPSSIDAAHFAQARGRMDEPADQAPLAHPRLGFFGVIDERMDLALLAALADARPAWQIVLLGPLAKLDAAELPRRPNLHFLGPKPYTELPRYLAGWDVALMPWAINDATRFISPTKTPEYLAAGRPVVSTPVADVVREYGESGLVRITATPADVVAAIESALDEPPAERAAWLARVDAHLARTSWDRTWAAMRAEIDRVASPFAPAADGAADADERAALAAD